MQTYCHQRNQWLALCIVICNFLFHAGLLIPLVGPSRTPIVSSARAATASATGISAYKQRNYSRAIPLLAQTLKTDPQNAEAAFYLAMAYTHLKQYSQAQKAFERAIQLLPQSSGMAKAAKNNLQYVIKKQITLASNASKANQVFKASNGSSSRDNYLTRVLHQGKVVRFSTARMPLRVYIASGQSIAGWHDSFKQSVVKAMQTWQRASRNRLRFSRTYNPENADIIVRWHKHFSDGILGLSPFQMTGNTLIQSDVNLALYFPNAQTPIPSAVMDHIALHELGHAIGLKGHSDNPNDIMYYSANPRQTGLTRRDVNTLSLLYKLGADVQNSAQTTTVRSKQSLQYFQLGVKAHQQNQFSTATKYYRRAIQLDDQQAMAKFNLGAILINTGLTQARQQQFSQARQQFQEAVTLYTQLKRLPNPPKNTDKNLLAAQKNLAVVSKK